MKRAYPIVSIILLFCLFIFHSSVSYGQSGFVFACGNVMDTNNNSTFSFGQIFYNNQETSNYYINEGLQQPFLYQGVDSVIVHNSDIPYEYRPQHTIYQVGDTTFYLLPTFGIDTIVAVTLYSVVCPNDTFATAEHSHSTYPVTLPQPIVYPIGNQEVIVDNNATPEYAVGENSTIHWNFSVGNSTVSCDQNVFIYFAYCGDTLVAIDADGNRYHAVRVGYHCWTKENMRATHYDDGSGRTIPMALIYQADMYPDTVENLNTYGRLYSWYSAVDVPEDDNVTLPLLTPAGNVQGICPQGWRIPTDAEIMSINNIAGIDGLRTDTLWIIPGTNVTNFTALPAGIYLNGKFNNLRGDTYFCTYNPHAIAANETFTIVGHLACTCPDLLLPQHQKSDATSVRCIKE